MKYLFLFLTFMVACSSNGSSPPISLMQVVEAFDNAKFPIINATVYDETTDPNKLLGRPGRYVEKMNFFDERDIEKKNECSIEIFKTAEDAKARKDYLDTVGKAASMFASYSYLHKNVLLRISYGVLPKDAEVYRQALESL